MSDIEILQKIEALIEHEKATMAGLDLDAQDDSGYTALMTAVLRDNLAAVELLLRLGADPDIENNDGETALILAVDDHKYPIVKALTQEAGINHENKHGDNALGYATYHEYDYIAEFLKHEGAVDTGKPTKMEIDDEELAELERQNWADFDEVYPDKKAHPFFEKLAVLQPPHRCEKYACTTCGGIIHHIRKNLTPTLRDEIQEFINSHTEEELQALGSSQKQLQGLIVLAGENP